MVVKKSFKDKSTYEKTLKQKSIEERLRREALEFKKQFANQLLKLVASGFGLVSALAWNEFIKELIKRYVEPFFGRNSGLVSLAVYALTVTFLAVLITYQLSKIIKVNEENSKV